MREDRCRAVAGPFHTVVNKLAIRDDRHAERQRQLNQDPAEDGAALAAGGACDGGADHEAPDPLQQRGVHCTHRSLDSRVRSRIIRRIRSRSVPTVRRLDVVFERQEEQFSDHHGRREEIPDP